MSWLDRLAAWGQPRHRRRPSCRQIADDLAEAQQQLAVARQASAAAEAATAEQRAEVVRLQEVIVAQDRAAAHRDQLLEAAQMAVDAHAAQLRGSGELVDRYAGQLAAIRAVAANERLDDTEAMPQVRELLVGDAPPPSDPTAGPVPGEPSCG